MINAYLGIDIGSISTKGVIIDADNNFLASEYIWTEGNPIEAVKRLLIFCGSFVFWPEFGILEKEGRQVTKGGGLPLTLNGDVAPFAVLVNFPSAPSWQRFFAIRFGKADGKEPLHRIFLPSTLPSADRRQSLCRPWLHPLPSALADGKF